jgi:fatty acid desaturase
MGQPSSDEIERLEQQALEAFRPKPKPIWQTVLAVVALLGGAYSLIWGNAILGGVLVICGTFLNWLFKSAE